MTYGELFEKLERLRIEKAELERIKDLLSSGMSSELSLSTQMKIVNELERETIGDETDHEVAE